jgi:SAM-dependent methyltransferase
MHPSADAVGYVVAGLYAEEGSIVVDVGGQSVNGSLRPHFEKKGARFLSVDMDAGPGVDIVVQPGMPLPFATGSVDIVVSTSCFEHDPFFWMTFKDMCRIVKPGGYVYINAPQSGPYHKHPGDNWRFNTDAAQALAAWSTKPIYLAEQVDSALASCDSVGAVRAALSNNVFPVVVQEQFFAGPWYTARDANWIDCCMLFKRVTPEEVQSPSIVLDSRAVYYGILCRTVRDIGVPTAMQIPL